MPITQFSRGPASLVGKPLPVRGAQPEHPGPKGTDFPHSLLSFMVPGAHSHVGTSEADSLERRLNPRRKVSSIVPVGLHMGKMGRRDVYESGRLNCPQFFTPAVFAPYEGGLVTSLAYFLFLPDASAGTTRTCLTSKLFQKMTETHLEQSPYSRTQPGSVNTTLNCRGGSKNKHCCCEPQSSSRGR